uniref:Uncharacterized protein n=1 Tax=Acrobeloides nanus TaxID=290746 RepID=A0A914D829_9BILA
MLPLWLIKSPWANESPIGLVLFFPPFTPGFVATWSSVFLSAVTSRRFLPRSQFITFSPQLQKFPSANEPPFGLVPFFLV